MARIRIPQKPNYRCAECPEWGCEKSTPGKSEPLQCLITSKRSPPRLSLLSFHTTCASNKPSPSVPRITESNKAASSVA
eukprot:4496546-Amphidinium_carterae.1